MPGALGVVGPLRIGVFGGSFDPVHHAHLRVARAAAQALPLDEVRLVPAGHQPFKGGRHVASAADRVAMLRAAVEDDPLFVVDVREAERPGPSYTIDTLRTLHAERRHDRLFLLVGADAARDLPQWRDAAAIGDLATVVALSRPGTPAPSDPTIGRVLAVPEVDVSATAVRARCARGEPIEALVPAAVARYIADRGLYREGT